ncbi:GNAT family N-acetyltransferase [Pseudactinotalea sp.]|uniref:GNAT family N-acetyltransferase n=1 Tax=Pseudactinotalea sp. TaxID=1926260 RepID=UPI003B3A83C5
MRIEGAAVSLRDWESGDAARLTDLLVPERPWHETNGPYFGRPTAQDLAGLRRRLLELAESPALPEPRTSLGVVRRSDDLLVGTVTWYWESEETDWRRLGIVLWDESVWGQGLGREALTLWTDYLFAATDALRLDLATYSGNPGMVALAKRAGFVEEARMRRARRWAGGVHDAVVLGVLREEWEAGRR